jgi:hypothetical protein
MAKTCYNKNVEEYQDLKGVYGSDLIVDAVIESYQKLNNKPEDFYPTVEQVADMVSGKGYTVKMDPVKAQIFKAAGDSSLSPQQRQVAQDLADFHLDVKFEEETHTYTHISGKRLESTTTLMKGELEDDGAYAVNRRIGNLFDRMLEAAVLGQSLDSVSMSFREEGQDVTLEIEDSLKEEIWNWTQDLVADLTAEGSVVVPQFRVSSLENGVAGSIDLLVIKPTGELEVLDLKSSKNSVLGENYDNPYPVKPSNVETGYKGSKLADEIGVEYLSTRQQHALQTGLYARMLANKGFNVTRTASYHVKYEMNEDATTAVGFDIEGYQEHNFDTDMKRYADVIVKLNDYNGTVDQSSELSRELGEEGKAEIPQEEEGIKINTFELALLVREKIYKPLSQRLKTLQDLYEKRVNITDPKRNLFVPKQAETIDALADLLYMIDKEGKTGKALLAYGRFMNYAIKDVEKFVEYVSNDKNLDREVTAGVLQNFSMFLRSYESIQKETATLDKLLPNEQLSILNKLKDKLAEGAEVLEASKKEWLMRNIQNSTSQALTREEIEQALIEAEDIARADRFAADITTSTDLILRLIDKKYKQQRIQADDAAARFNQKVDDAVADLVRLSPRESGGTKAKVDYSFMYEEINGEYLVIDRLGSNYSEKVEELKAKLYDSKGDYIQYREVKDVTKANPEDLAFNKEVFENRKAYNEFLKAEIIENGVAKDGSDHRYTAEFKAERAKYEMLVGKRWVKKTGVSDYEYRRYRNKYYNTLSDIVVPIKNSKGQTNGATKRVTIEVVDRKYVEPRDVSADGTKYLNPRYEALMNPTTELGRAQKKFYEFYMDEWVGRQLSTLPNEYEGYLKHKVPVLEDHVQNFANLPVPLAVIVRIAKSLKDFFGNWQLPVPQVKRTKLDENGNIVSSVPLFIPGYRSPEKAKALLEEIDAAQQKARQDLLDKKITAKQYRRLKQDLRTQRRRIENMPTQQRVDVNIADAIKAHSAQVSYYNYMTQLEDTFAIFKQAARDRSYYSRSEIQADGTELKEYIKPEEVRTTQRLDKWFKMTYNKENYFDNLDWSGRMIEVGVRKLLQGSSLLYVGLSPIANMSNYIWGRASTIMETAGGRYYNRRAMMNAVKLYNSDFLQGVMLKTVKGFDKEFNFKSNQAQSKYEAIANHFNMARQLVAGEERSDAPIPGAYNFQDAAEFNVQSKTGVAILLSQTLVDQNGNEVSIYDAYDFNSETGEVTLQPGDWTLLKRDDAGNVIEEVPYNEVEKANVQNYIYEVNKQMHGNYAEEDRAAWQDNTMGVMAFQFHKWIYPAWKAHFKRRYYDENLGYYEGRFISLLNFGRALYDYGSWAEAVKSTDNLAKSNIKKLGAQLAIFTTTLIMGNVLRGLSKGLEDGDMDDDDKKQVRKALNMLSFLNDRLGGESVFFFMPWELLTAAETPFASSRYIKNIWEALTTTFFTSVYGVAQDHETLLENKSVYYQKGSRKGQLKLAKEWQDVIPGLYQLNRFKAFETVNKDYRAN